MRNLKKFLALVLAMMMTLSLMITVNAASDFTDVDTITDEFSEGVAVLKGLGVFEGYPDGSFQPKGNITRAEVATIVYRLATGDTKGVQAHLYKDYATFTDVKSDHWAAGYINYCANAEWIAGYGNGKFGPSDSVTGYQAAAMILRAVGYGKNDEFKGSGWQVQVANVTRSEGLLVNVDDTTYANTLNQPATRELIAEILFQAGLIDTVDWTMLLGYRPTGKGSLAQINFNLHVTTIGVIDEWGNPGYYWIKGSALKSNLSNVVATIGFEPNMTFTDVKRECDIAHEMKISTSKNFVLYVNDGEYLTPNYLVVATDTVTKVGGQGRLTKVYGDLSHPHIANNTWPASVTMVDTFLAQVTGVSNAVVDAAGHVIIPAKLTVSIYDRAQTTDKVANPSANRIISKSSTDATNWEYSKGDMVLLNAYTDHAYRTSWSATDAADAAAHASSVAAHTNVEQAAYQTERVAVKGYAYLDELATYNTAKQVNDVEYAEVLGVAKSTVAKQTVVYWNSEKHDVGGTEYPDQLDLFLDVAGTTTNSDFTWYFDQYNNVIGIGEAIKSNYGVITSIYSSFSTADGATDGKSVAKAHVKYSDGSEGDVIIDRFVVSGDAKLDDGHNAADTAMLANKDSLELLPVYDFSAGDVKVMTAGSKAAGYTKPANVEESGQLYVSPVASINKASEEPQVQGNGGVTTSKYYGIIEQNLFKFVTSGDGKLTAIEVAGKVDPGTTNENNDIYVGHYNALDENNASEWKKNLGFVSVNGKTIRLDNNTQIMLKEGTEIKTYKGLSELPGDVTIAKLTEVDWADYNGDGIADVLYTTATVKGNITHGLFYYTNGAAQWNGADKKGTLAGYLNGEATTLTFSNEKLFNLVKNCGTLGTGASTPYVGHIFAVEITNNEVTNLFGTPNKTPSANDYGERFASASAVLLNNDNDGGLMKNKVALNSIDMTKGIGTDAYSKTGAVFVTGAAGGNSYTKNTKVVAKQVTGAAGTYANGIVTVGGAPYYLTGVSKTLGNDLSYLNLAGRKSDVTIVFEAGALDTIVEIYVTTEPDDTNTPVGTTVTFGSDITKAPTGLGSDANLANWLKGFSGGVFYCTDQKTGTTHATEATMLYFPFVSPTATGSAVLEIRNASGTLVYSEANNLTAAGALLYSFDFANATGSWMISPKGLTAGTYSYNITVNGTSVSSGTFTLVLK